MFFSCSVAAAKEARADSSSTAILAENMNTRRLSDGFQPSVLINWEGGGLLESKINRETPILLVQPDGARSRKRFAPCRRGVQFQARLGRLVTLGGSSLLLKTVNQFYATPHPP